MSHGTYSFNLLPALLARPVQLQLVSLDDEAVRGGDFVLELLDGLVLELGDGAAAGADQMIMVLPFVYVLIPGLAVAELDLPCNPRFGKQLQGPVDRGVADARVLR